MIKQYHETDGKRGFINTTRGIKENFLSAYVRLISYLTFFILNCTAINKLTKFYIAYKSILLDITF